MPWKTPLSATQIAAQQRLMEREKELLDQYLNQSTEELFRKIEAEMRWWRTRGEVSNDTDLAIIRFLREMNFKYLPSNTRQRYTLIGTTPKMLTFLSLVQYGVCEKWRLREKIESGRYKTDVDLAYVLFEFIWRYRAIGFMQRIAPELLGAFVVEIGVDRLCDEC